MRVAVLLLQELDRFFQHAAQPVLLVVRRHHDGHEHLPWADLVPLFRGFVLPLCHFFPRPPFIHPAGQLLRLARPPIRQDRPVRSLRPARGTWHWRRDEERDIQLQRVSQHRDRD